MTCAHRGAHWFVGRRYTYQDGDDRYVVSFTRSRDLTTSRMVDAVTRFKRIAAKLMHFDGAYLRFVGDLQISRHRGEELVETYKDDAIWELMYFGQALSLVRPNVTRL